MPSEQNKQRYFVSVTHGLIQDVRNDSNEYEVLLTAEELSLMQDVLNEVAEGDSYAFRRAFVPYKSADHDEAADEFDDKTRLMYEYLHRYGSVETRKLIESMNVLPKLENTGYEDKGYGGGSPTNK